MSHLPPILNTLEAYTEAAADSRVNQVVKSVARQTESPTKQDQHSQLRRSQHKPVKPSECQVSKFSIGKTSEMQESSLIVSSTLETPRPHQSPRIKNFNVSEAHQSSPGPQYNSSFAQAIESLAAIKLHSYAVKRKEQMRGKKKLLQEICSYQKANYQESRNDIDQQYVEKLAAWKLRYYIEYLRLKSSNKKQEDDHKRHSVGDDLQKHEINRLRSELAESQQISEQFRNLHESSLIKEENLQISSGALKNDLCSTQTEIVELKDQLTALQAELKSNEETKLLNEQNYEQRTEIIQNELSVTRRTCAEFVKTIAELQIQLERLVQDSNEQLSLRNAEIDEDSSVIQSQKQEIMNLQQRIVEIQKADEDSLKQCQHNFTDIVQNLTSQLAHEREVNKALTVQITGHKGTIAHLQNVLEKTEAGLQDQCVANVDLNSDLQQSLDEKQSLQALITDLALKQQVLEKHIAEVTVTAESHKSKYLKLKYIKSELITTVGFLETELSSAQIDIARRSQHHSELLCMYECVAMRVEELEALLVAASSSLASAGGYCRFLENQLFSARKTNTPINSRGSISPRSNSPAFPRDKTMNNKINIGMSPDDAEEDSSVVPITLEESDSPRRQRERSPYGQVRTRTPSQDNSSKPANAKSVNAALKRGVSFSNNPEPMFLDELQFVEADDQVDQAVIGSANSHSEAVQQSHAARRPNRVNQNNNQRGAYSKTVHAATDSAQSARDIQMDERLTSFLSQLEDKMKQMDVAAHAIRTATANGGANVSTFGATEIFESNVNNNNSNNSSNNNNMNNSLINIEILKPLIATTDRACQTIVVPVTETPPIAVDKSNGNKQLGKACGILGRKITDAAEEIKNLKLVLSWSREHLSAVGKRKKKLTLLAEKCLHDCRGCCVDSTFNAIMKDLACMVMESLGACDKDIDVIVRNCLVHSRSMSARLATVAKLTSTVSLVKSGVAKYLGKQEIDSILCEFHRFASASTEDGWSALKTNTSHLTSSEQRVFNNILTSVNMKPLNRALFDLYDQNSWLARFQESMLTKDFMTNVESAENCLISVFRFATDCQISGDDVSTNHVTCLDEQSVAEAYDDLSSGVNDMPMPGESGLSAESSVYDSGRGLAQDNNSNDFGTTFNEYMMLNDSVDGTDSVGYYQQIMRLQQNTTSSEQRLTEPSENRQEIMCLGGDEDHYTDSIVCLAQPAHSQFSGGEENLTTRPPHCDEENESHVAFFNFDGASAESFIKSVDSTENLDFDGFQQLRADPQNETTSKPLEIDDISHVETFQPVTIQSSETSQAVGIAGDEGDMSTLKIHPNQEIEFMEVENTSNLEDIDEQRVPPNETYPDESVSCEHLVNQISCHVQEEQSSVPTAPHNDIDQESLDDQIINTKSVMKQRVRQVELLIKEVSVLLPIKARARQDIETWVLNFISICGRRPELTDKSKSRSFNGFVAPLITAQQKLCELTVELDEAMAIANSTFADLEQLYDIVEKYTGVRPDKYYFHFLIPTSNEFETLDPFAIGSDFPLPIDSATMGLSSPTRVAVPSVKLSAARPRRTQMVVTSCNNGEESSVVLQSRMLLDKCAQDEATELAHAAVMAQRELEQTGGEGDERTDLYIDAGGSVSLNPSMAAEHTGGQPMVEMSLLTTDAEGQASQTQDDSDVASEVTLSPNTQAVLSKYSRNYRSSPNETDSVNSVGEFDSFSYRIGATEYATSPAVVTDRGRHAANEVQELAEFSTPRARTAKVPSDSLLHDSESAQQRGRQRAKTASSQSSRHTNHAVMTETASSIGWLDQEVESKKSLLQAMKTDYEGIRAEAKAAEQARAQAKTVMDAWEKSFRAGNDGVDATSSQRQTLAAEQLTAYRQAQEVMTSKYEALAEFKKSFTEAHAALQMLKTKREDLLRQSERHRDSLKNVLEESIASINNEIVALMQEAAELLHWTTELNQQNSSLKKEIKKWTKAFLEEHHRPPNNQDKKEIIEVYTRYGEVKTSLSSSTARHGAIQDELSDLKQVLLEKLQEFESLA